jgi:hypothetical protein
MESNDAQRLATALDTNSSAIVAMIEALGMHWENEWIKQCGNTIAYGEDNFIKLIEKHLLQGI